MRSWRDVGEGGRLVAESFSSGAGLQPSVCWWPPVGSSLLVYRRWKDERDQGCLKRCQDMESCRVWAGSDPESEPCRGTLMKQEGHHSAVSLVGDLGADTQGFSSEPGRLRWQNGPQQVMSDLRVRTDRAGEGGGDLGMDQAGRA